ncbi:ATP-binding cassette domain-containing protein [Brachyspira hyodysenteriae]|uniref:ATP-binding cassette domain-containing protein n=1 Tax=Brachyspira hyodysenteriae TaxID=159 RepID=UPI0022CD52CC|nr:ATP-binding cassette domain-containing protein [Brachyspira hyodysenteriae]MDA0055759.1 ATP-binding cassette domain-containing protein [Brachyspira hyodysenteriae]
MLNIKDLSVFYDSNEVLSNINFSLNKGDYLSIIGENGSGKTTLIKTILGLIKPKKGNVSFNSIKKNEIGYLPQQGIVQKSFPASVFEVVISGRLNKKKFLPFYTSKDKKMTLDNLKKA